MAKILVVDDDKTLRERLKRLLDLDDHEIFIAENGMRGLEVFDKEGPEIVILDIKMPGMDGIEVLWKIKERSDVTEVIIITGHGGVETAIEAMKGGAFGYIQKPIEYDELEIEIKKVLEKQEMKKKLDEHVLNLESAIKEKAEEISRRKQAEEELIRERDQAKALLNLYQLPESSVQDFSGFVISECIKMSESELGFFGFINEVETLMMAHLWSKKAMENCAIDSKPVEFSLGNAGIWAEAIREHRPIIVNDYEKPDSRKKGYPEGHVPISRLMSIPIVEGGRAVAIVAVANKKQDYSESDILHLSVFLQNAWGLLQRKQAEESLKESEERYRTLVENVPVAVYRTTPGPEGKFLMANPAFLKMFGFDSEEELKEITAADVYMNPEERKAFSDHLLAQGGVIGLERHLKKKDGTPFWGSATYKVVCDESRKETYFDCTIMDITERKLAVEALRESEEKYRITLQSIPDSVCITRQKDGLIFYANDGFSQTMGYSMEEIEGKTPHDLNLFVNPVERDEFIKILKEKGEVRGFELQYRKKDGTIFDALLSARPLKYGDEDCLVSVVKDITPIKESEREKAKLQAQLQHAQRMESIGTLAGGLAHNFNNLLMSIIGNASIVLLDLNPDHPHYKNLKNIEKNVKSGS